MDKPHFAFDSTENSVSLTAVFASTMERELMRHAIDAFGHLSNDILRERGMMTLDEFADLIKKHYDIANPQTNEVVRNLRVLARRTIPNSDIPADNLNVAE